MPVDCIDHSILTVADIERSGATGAIVSTCLRGPDGNLLEVSNTIEA